MVSCSKHLVISCFFCILKSCSRRMRENGVSPISFLLLEDYFQLSTLKSTKFVFRNVFVASDCINQTVISSYYDYILPFCYIFLTILFKVMSLPSPTLTSPDNTKSPGPHGNMGGLDGDPMRRIDSICSQLASRGVGSMGYHDGFQVSFSEIRIFCFNSL